MLDLVLPILVALSSTFSSNSAHFTLKPAGLFKLPSVFGALGVFELVFVKYVYSASSMGHPFSKRQTSAGSK